MKDVYTKTHIKVYRNQQQKIQRMWFYLVFINQYEKLVVARLEMFEIFFDTVLQSQPYCSAKKCILV